MSAIFKVGEIAIFQNAQLFPMFNGEECVVIEVGVKGLTCNGECLTGYRVKFKCGFVGVAAPYQLRRRKPPATGEQSILALFHVLPQRDSVPA